MLGPLQFAYGTGCGEGEGVSGGEGGSKMQRWRFLTWLPASEMQMIPTDGFFVVQFSFAFTTS